MKTFANLVLLSVLCAVSSNPINGEELEEEMGE